MKINKGPRQERSGKNEIYSCFKISNYFRFLFKHIYNWVQNEEAEEEFRD